MDQILARVKRKRAKPYFKLISDEQLFEPISVNLESCVRYEPDHNLDEDAWFKIDNFSNQEFCLDILKSDFDSKDYDDLVKEQFSEITYIISVQSENFYFQKITPRLYVTQRFLAFSEIAKLEESSNRLSINPTPDAVYFKQEDTLIFRKLAIISSIFKGIDQLYREATNEEVEQFLGESFIKLENDYERDKVSKPNRKRIGLAMKTVEDMSNDNRTHLLTYIDEYCDKKLTFDEENQQFSISTDDELKLLLYGLEQRFYTTEIGHEKRVANSVTKME